MRVHRIKATHFIEVYYVEWHNIVYNTDVLDIDMLKRCLEGSKHIGFETIAIWKIKQTCFKI
jgi:hypothetical protein